jgi:hypothetical protein
LLEMGIYQQLGSCRVMHPDHTVRERLAGQQF